MQNSGKSHMLRKSPLIDLQRAPPDRQAHQGSWLMVPVMLASARPPADDSFISQFNKHFEPLLILNNEQEA